MRIRVVVGVERRPMAPGDVVILNDPYAGGTARAGGVGVRGGRASDIALLPGTRHRRTYRLPACARPRSARSVSTRHRQTEARLYPD
jgi:hypothetical protein